MYAIRVNENTANQVQFRTPPVRSDSDLIGFFIGDNKMLDIMAIPLTKGFFTLVDGKNYKRLNKYSWYASINGRTHYAVRGNRKKGKAFTTILMHREILRLKPHDGLVTDHENHCGLDNREVNIRICSHQQNHHNSQLQANNKSGWKGVGRHKESKKWWSQIKYNGKVIYLGVFTNKIDAAKAYDEKAKELFGEFAYLNFKKGR